MTNPTPHGQVPEALIYAELPDLDDTLWLAIGQHRRAITIVETSAAAKAVDAAVHRLLRDYADATHALRTTPVQNPAEIEHVAGDVSKNGAESNIYETAFTNGWNRRASLSLPAAGREPVGEVEPGLRFTGGFHVRLYRGALRPEPGAKLYAAPPTAPATQQVGEVVAYLDVGANGYLDLGSELSEDALQQLPKGRHALVIAGTYGIDGYVAAPQPSPTAQAADPLQPLVDLQEQARMYDGEFTQAAESVPAMSDAARDLLTERARQVQEEGWTPEHDDEHSCGEMAEAAACYAASARVPTSTKRLQCPGDWPWAAKWWKPSDQRRDLIKAGALILAELERIDRATRKQEHAGQKPQKIDECYGDCPTDPTTCTNPCRFDGRAARAPAESVLEDAARLEALHAAVTAIYFDDSSDFKSALGAVVRHLDPKLAGDLLAWPKRAFDISKARLDAARKQGGQHGAE